MDRYTGTILKDRYVLEDMIGSGGMAVVYRATDRVTGNDVAVKILKDEFVADEQFRRRFFQRIARHLHAAPPQYRERNRL